MIATGNIHNVFDRRTPDSNDNVVGARAGVAWMDVADPATYSLHGLPGSLPWTGGAPRDDSPGCFRSAPGEFCVVEPLYQQEHFKHIFAPVPIAPYDSTRKMGRCDMALLRCCDVVGDDEIAVNMQYFRFEFDFNPPASIFSGGTRTTLTAGEQPNFVHAVATNVANRWNGKEDFSRNEAVLLPKTPGSLPLKVRSLWFVQGWIRVPASPSRFMPHFWIGVFKEVRANMNSSTGLGELGEGDQIPISDNDPDFNGALTAAHETGHAGSLADEYIEVANCASYYQNGFKDSIAGSPYCTDKRAMMMSGIQVNPRNFWHVSEWLRALYSKEFKVRHGRFNFNLDPDPLGPLQTRVTDPIEKALNTTNGPRGRFDVYLYRLGEERFREILVPGLTFGGIIPVVVKMEFTFPDTYDHGDIKEALEDIQKGLYRTFSELNRFAARGTVNGESLDCFLHISPRYLVTNFSADPEIMEDMNVTNKQGYEAEVNEIRSHYGRHFRVELREGGGSRFDPASSNHLFFDMDDNDLEDDFVPFFAEMLGIPREGIESVTSYKSIVQKVIPDPHAMVRRLP